MKVKFWIAFLFLFSLAGSFSKAGGHRQSSVGSFKGRSSSFAVETFKGSIPIDGVSETEFPKMAKLSLIEAMHAALLATSGNALSISLEGEDGFLAYAVEVRNHDSGLHEIMIDAGNGKIISNQIRNQPSSRGHQSEDGDLEEKTARVL